VTKLGLFGFVILSCLVCISTINVSLDASFLPTSGLESRDRPKFGCGFGAKTGLKLPVSTISVYRIISHSVSDSQPKLEWMKLMEDLQHWMGLHTLH